ncbi:MAG: hypothetical protein RSA41_07630 [Christensenella sp.]
MKVLIAFTDDKDGGYVYAVGEEYPRAGTKPTEERMAYLTGNKNNFGAPVIEGKQKVRKEGV